MSNKNYENVTYTVAIEVERSPEFVFNHILNDVSKFWPEDFEGESNKLNAEFIFTSGGGSHYSKNKVIELVPNKKVVWLVTESIRRTDNFEWTWTKMIYKVNEKNGKTQVEFTYDGVVWEGEYEGLVKVCDMVIKERLYDLLMSNS
jgi:hypothetical protein